MTELTPEALAALASVAAQVTPPGFEASVDVREGALQVVVGLRPCGPAYGGGQHLDYFLLSRPEEMVMWVTGAVHRCVGGIVAMELRPLVEKRNAARERWKKSNRQPEAVAYHKAQLKLEDACRRRFGSKVIVP